MREASPLLGIERAALTHSSDCHVRHSGNVDGCFSVIARVRLEQGRTCSTSSAWLTWHPFTSEEEENLDSPNSRIEKLTGYMQTTRCINGLQER